MKWEVRQTSVQSLEYIYINIFLWIQGFQWGKKPQNEMHWAKTVKFWPPKSNHAFIEIIKINAVTFLTAGHPDLNYFPGTSVAHNPCSFLVFTRSTFNISQRALKLIAGRFLKTRPCLLYIHFFPFFAISKPVEHAHMRVGSIMLH